MASSGRAGHLLAGVAGLCAFLHGARVARRTAMTAGEARWFSVVNGLPEQAFVPVWAVMQLGSLGGAVATGVVVAAAGQPRLGRQLAAVGTLTWLSAKAAKPLARRGRPGRLVETARIRGREQVGLGYPSGHAAVSAALAALSAPALPRRWRPVPWVTAAVVGASRVYVGAHLPLDVAGGFALGVATGTGTRAVMDRGSRPGGPSTPSAAAAVGRAAPPEPDRR